MGEHEPKVQWIQEQEVMQEREQKQELLIAAKNHLPRFKVERWMKGLKRLLELNLRQRLLYCSSPSHQ